MKEEAIRYFNDAMTFLNWSQDSSLERGRTLESYLDLQNYYIKAAIKILQEVIKLNQK